MTARIPSEFTSSSGTVTSNKLIGQFSILACSRSCICKASPIFISIVPRPNKYSPDRSEEHTSELQSRGHLVCRLLLEKKKKKQTLPHHMEQRTAHRAVSH